MDFKDYAAMIARQNGTNKNALNNTAASQKTKTQSKIGIDLGQYDFGNDMLNIKFIQTVQDAKKAGSKSPLKDGYSLMLNYIDTAQKSNAYGSKNYMQAAENYLQKQFREIEIKDTFSNVKTYEDMLTEWNKRGNYTNSQAAEKSKENIMGVEIDTEIMEKLGENPTDDQLYQARKDTLAKKNRWMKDADENNDYVYNIHWAAGKMMQNPDKVEQLLYESNGVSNIKDERLRAALSMMVDDPEYSGIWRKYTRGNASAEDMSTAILGFATKMYNETGEALDVYLPRNHMDDMDDETKYLYYMMYSDPEGAKNWVEDVKGTDAEEAARSNLYFVTKKYEAEQLKNEQDFETISKKNEQFMGDNTYKQINSKYAGGYDEDKHTEEYFEKQDKTWKDVMQMSKKNGGFSIFNPATWGKAGDISAETLTELKDYLDTEIYSFMTDDEKKIYNAAYAKLGKKAAEDYLEAITYDILQRRKEHMQNASTAGMDGVDGAIVKSLGSIPLNMLRGLGAIEVAGQQLRNKIAGENNYKPVHFNTLGNLYGSMADNYRQSTMEQVDMNVNIFGKEVDLFDKPYGLIMSVVDSVAAAYVGGGSKRGSSVLMGTQAFQASMADAYERGATTDQALALGLGAGIAETLFEHFSIGVFFEQANRVGKGGMKAFIKNEMISAGVNGSEEFFTECANAMNEFLVMNDSSQYEMLYDYLVNDMLVDEGTARSIVASEVGFRLVEAGFGGALQGFGMSSVAEVSNRVNTKNTGKAITSTESRMALKAIAEGMGTETESHKMAKKIDWNTVKDMEIGRLYRQVGQDMSDMNLFGQDKKNARTVLSDRLKMDIETRMDAIGKKDKGLAESITKYIMGYNLTAEETQKMLADENAVMMLRELAGNELIGEGEKAEETKKTETVKEEAEEDFEAIPKMEDVSAEQKEAEERAVYEAAGQGKSLDEIRTLAKNLSEEELQSAYNDGKEVFDAQQERIAQEQRKEQAEKVKSGIDGSVSAAKDMAEDTQAQAEEMKQRLQESWEQRKARIAEENQKKAVEMGNGVIDGSISAAKDMAEDTQAQAEEMKRRLQEGWEQRKARIAEAEQAKKEEKEKAEKERAEKAEQEERQIYELSGQGYSLDELRPYVKHLTEEEMQSAYNDGKEVFDAQQARIAEENRKKAVEMGNGVIDGSISAAKDMAEDTQARAEEMKQRLQEGWEQRKARIAEAEQAKKEEKEKAEKERAEKAEQEERQIYELSGQGYSLDELRPYVKHLTEEEMQSAYNDGKEVFDAQQERIAQEQRKEQAKKVKSVIDGSVSAAKDMAEDTQAQAEEMKQKLEDQFEQKKAENEGKTQEDEQKQKTVTIGEHETKYTDISLDDEGIMQGMLPDGEKVSGEALELSDNEKELIEATDGMNHSEKGAVIANAKGVENVRAYVRGARRVFMYGYEGKDLGKSKSIFVELLTEEQKQAIYEAGQKWKVQEAENKIQKNAEIANKHGFMVDNGTNNGKSGVIFSSVTKDLTNKQKVQLKLIDEFAKKNGLSVRVYDTLGQQNAQYHEGTNQIDLALDTDDGALTRVISHELFHFIESWNKEAARKLREFVVERLQAAEEYDIEERINDFIERYRFEKDEKGRDNALSEIAADSMMDIIGTESNLKDLIKTDKGLTQKIIDWAKKTAQQLKGLIEKFAARSAEARALTKDLSYLERIGEMVENALNEAKENMKMAHKDLFASAKENKHVQDYLEDMEEATSAEDREAYVNGLLYSLFIEAELEWMKRNYTDEMDMDAVFRKFRDALVSYAKKERALAKAVEAAGFDVPDSKYNAALAYAARQALEAMNKGMEDVKYALKYFEANGKEYTYVEEDRDVNKKFSMKDENEENKQIFDKAKEIFGKTYNWNLTGYILPDGTRLNFSGEREGSDGRSRQEDHREIWEAYSENTDMSENEAMIDFMRRGAIRIIPESNGININRYGKITKAQWDALDDFIARKRGEVTVDIDKENGDTMASKEYNRGTYSKSILESIKELLKDAETEKSTVAQFHGDTLYSMKDTGGTDGKDLNEAIGEEARKKRAEEREYEIEALTGGSIEDMREELEESNKAYQLLKEMHKLSLDKRGTAFWNKKIDKIARKLKERYATKYSLSEMKKDLALLFKAMDDRDYNIKEILSFANDIAHEITKKAIREDVRDERVIDAYKAIRGSVIYLDKHDAENIRGIYGSIRNFNRSHFGLLSLTTKKSYYSKGHVSSIEGIYEYLDPGDHFEGSYTHGVIHEYNDRAYSEDDMLEKIIDFMERNSGSNYLGESGIDEEMKRAMPYELMLEYYNIQENFGGDDVSEMKKKMEEQREEWEMKTKEKESKERERQKEKIDELKAKYKESIKKIRKQAREKAKERERLLKAGFKERLIAQKERKERTESRRKMKANIERKVQYIRSRVENPTDIKHVPEGLLEAAKKLVENFTSDEGTLRFSKDTMLELLNEYRNLVEGGEYGDLDASAGWSEEIEDMIQVIANKIDGKTIEELDDAELMAINDIVSNIQHIIAKTSEIVIKGRREKLSKLGQSMLMNLQKKSEGKDGSIRSILNKYKYGQMTPRYFFDMFGESVIKDIGDDMFEAQGKYAKVQKEAKNKLEGLEKKYDVNKWINSKENLRFTTRNGDVIELTVQQALSLYAVYNREITNTAQEARHLTKGGFMYESNTKINGVETKRPHIIHEADMRMVREWLGEEKMKFVDDMIEFLSVDMARLGNEISMELYGYEKFKEKYYFPYDVSNLFTVSDIRDTENARPALPQNAKLAKATVKKASNPIVIRDFIQVWADHVSQMGMYYGFSLPCAAIQRVYNYRESAEFDSYDMDEAKLKSPITSVKAEINRVYGKEASNYLATLMFDISGGMQVDNRTGISKWLSIFKKNAVAGNLSVVFQQPSSIARAMNVLNPKYFLGKINIKKNIQEMAEHSGIAIIKEMGRFDTGVGKRGQDWVTESIKDKSLLKRAGGRMDKITGAGAEYADKVTWANIWAAVKRELAEKGIVEGVDNYWEMVAERFEDVVNHTQVYDSTLSRSHFMRGKDFFSKIVTSFMAEPTLTFNVLQNAWMNIKQPGGKKKAARALATWTVTALLNALLQSLATAGRKKDEEDKTFLEKYAGEVVNNFTESWGAIGIVKMIPIASDMVSIFEGYDVKRTDMAVVEEIKGTMDILLKADKTPEEKIRAIVTTASSVLGIPVKNVWREFVSAINVANSTPISETTWRDMKYSMLEGLPKRYYDSSNKAYQERMEEALNDGDMEEFEELHGYLEERTRVKDETLKTMTKSAMKNSYAEDGMDNDRAMDMLMDYLGFDKDKAYFEVDEWEFNKEGGEGNYKQYGSLFKAIETGDGLQKEIKALMDHGKDKATIASQITQEFKPIYIETYKTNKTKATNLKARLLTAYAALGYDREKKKKDIEAWLK